MNDKSEINDRGVVVDWGQAAVKRYYRRIDVAKLETAIAELKIKQEKYEQNGLASDEFTQADHIELICLLRFRMLLEPIYHCENCEKYGDAGCEDFLRKRDEL